MGRSQESVTCRTPPKKVATRLTSGLRKYQKIFSLAHDRDVNESDTVVIITDFLSEVLGFKKYTEITTEFSIRGTYCDLAVKIAGKVQYLIEAKAVGITLKENHIRQAINYASQHGVEWVILTNGASWKAYRLRFEQPIQTDTVFNLDLLSASSRDSEVIKHLYLLTREGIARSAIEDFQQQKDACSPFLVGSLLLTPPVLSVIRRELRRISPAAKIDEAEIHSVLKEDVLKREVVEGEQAQSAAARIKRAAARSLRKRATKDTPQDELPSSSSTPAGSPK